MLAVVNRFSYLVHLIVLGIMAYRFMTFSLVHCCSEVLSNDSLDTLVTGGLMCQNHGVLLMQCTRRDRFTGLFCMWLMLGGIHPSDYSIHNSLCIEMP